MADPTTPEVATQPEAPGPDLDLEARRALVLETLEQVRPYLNRDGGDCEFVDLSPDGKVVYLRLQGACRHCPSATFTIKLGIEQLLREQVPGIEAVESVP